MPAPILTIGIPTYNRPRSIVNTVRVLLPQLNDNVVLKVWDNCSDIPVTDLFTDEEKSKFIIIRNKVNIGGDANICGVIYHSDTKWVWLLGDDDYPLDDAVETILGYIHKYPDELLFKFNSYLERETRSFEDLADFCKYRYIYSNLLFISTGIYNRDKLKGDLQYYYINLSAMNGQTIFIFKHLEKISDKCLFTKDKVVAYSIYGLDNGQLPPDKIEGGWSWNKVSYVRRSSLIFEVFTDRRTFLNKNLFKGIAFIYLRYVFLSDISAWEKVKLFKYVLKIVGLYNIIRYNGLVLCQFLIKGMMPNIIYSKIKEIGKKRYTQTAIRNNQK